MVELFVECGAGLSYLHCRRVLPGDCVVEVEVEEVVFSIACQRLASHSSASLPAAMASENKMRKKGSFSM